jgi:hypothetical protein
MNLTEAQQKKSQEIEALCTEFRGKFLSAGAWIESILSEMLTQQYCTDPKRRSLFFSEFMDSGDITFSRKTELLITVLERFHPKVLAAYPKLKDRLDKFRRFRNRLAHSHPDTSLDRLSDGKTDEVVFVFYEDGQTKFQTVTFTEAKQRADETNRLRDELVKILNAIKTD